jgi:UDPglucose--hexose-1-phosphate uridylyltransferase
MSILRKDPVSGGWVIMSEDRARRPRDLQPVATTPSAERRFCPFCEGNESSTAPEIIAERSNGGRGDEAGWSLRVVPNRAAVLRIEGQLDRSGDGIYDMMSGVGAHEVVIETADHEGRIGQYGQAKMESLIGVFRQRVVDLNCDSRFQYIQIFRNYGAAAGAQLEHPHSQIIALPITPRSVKEELDNAREHYEYKERCLFCDIVNQEIKDRSRVVYENESFLALAPFASKFPFETWIVPKTHNHDFQFLSDSEMGPLAEALRRTLLGIELALENPPMNLIFHSAPRLPSPGVGLSADRYYHWHIEIFPRVTPMAGFEWGTGFYINPTLPENAAEYLAEVISEHPEPEEPVE